jgi:energy-coupling factor transporter ATP-binding protein EcfA2
MIESLTVKDPSKTPIKWLKDVPALSKPRAFAFTPGLNVLWGRNGSGKSTILTLLARALHCHTSGFPVITVDSLRELLDNAPNDKPEQALEGIEIRHDGQGVRYFNPEQTVGLAGGGAYFDDDFFGEGVRTKMFDIGQSCGLRDFAGRP